MKSFREFMIEDENDGPNVKYAKERIKRERKTDRKKFDRILDRAIVDDARLKARNTKPKNID